MSLSPSLQYIFIHCGTNNIGHHDQKVILDGLINLARVVKKKYKDVKITKMLSLPFVSQLNSVLEKTHETSQEPHLAYSYKSAISFTLNKEEFPPLLSVYSSMGSFNDTAKSSVRVRKSSDKSIFPISQPNTHNSVSSQKSKTRIEILMKFDKIRPTLKSSKVPSKLYLDYANKVLHKDVLKPRFYCHL